MGDLMSLSALVDFVDARAKELQVRAEQVPAVLDPPPPGEPFWRDTAGHPIYEPRERLVRQADSLALLVARWRAAAGSKHGRPSVYELALEYAAAMFSDHPDYQSEWRP